MGYNYKPPTKEQIAEYLALAAARTPATRVHFDAFERMINDLKKTPVTGEPLWLRDGEVFLHTYGRLPQRHCAWGRYSTAEEGVCGRPVVQVRLTWGLECWGGPEDHNYLYNQGFWIDSWRHLDGTPLHQRKDGSFGPECNACDPVPLCPDCGQTFFDNHCRTCHTSGSLVTAMLAYGNDTTCKTDGCDYHDYYSIGD
jgi:hypothetical protein